MNGLIGVMLLQMLILGSACGHSSTSKHTSWNRHLGKGEDSGVSEMDTLEDGDASLLTQKSNKVRDSVIAGWLHEHQGVPGSALVWQARQELGIRAGSFRWFLGPQENIKVVLRKEPEHIVLVEGKSENQLSRQKVFVEIRLRQAQQGAVYDFYWVQSDGATHVIRNIKNTVRLPSQSAHSIQSWQLVRTFLPKQKKPPVVKTRVGEKGDGWAKQPNDDEGLGLPKIIQWSVLNAHENDYGSQCLAISNQVDFEDSVGFTLPKHRNLDALHVLAKQRILELSQENSIRHHPGIFARRKSESMELEKGWVELLARSSSLEEAYRLWCLSPFHRFILRQTPMREYTLVTGKHSPEFGVAEDTFNVVLLGRRDASKVSSSTLVETLDNIESELRLSQQKLEPRKKLRRLRQLERECQRTTRQPGSQDLWEKCIVKQKRDNLNGRIRFEMSAEQNVNFDLQKLLGSSGAIALRAEQSGPGLLEIRILFFN